MPRPRPLRQRAPPPGLFGGELQHAAWRGRSPSDGRSTRRRSCSPGGPAPPCERSTCRSGPMSASRNSSGSLPAACGQLVDERADGEAVVDGVHRAVPADAGVRDGGAGLDAQVRDRVRDVARAVGELVAVGAGDVGGEARGDRRIGRAVAPGDDRSRAVEAGFEAVRGDAVVVAVLQVVLARPLHAHRGADLAGEPGGLAEEVGLRLAAEGAAEERHVDGDLVDLHLETVGDRRPRVLRRLGGGPDLDETVLHLRHRDHRLHLGVREVRQVVLGRDPARRRGEPGFDVALRAARASRRRAPRPRGVFR